MIPRFIGKLIGPVPPSAKEFITGLTISAALVLGGALINVGAITSVTDWLRTLAIGEAVTAGNFIVRQLGSKEPATTTTAAPK